MDQFLWQPCVKMWIAALEKARKQKNEQYQLVADECARFYSGNYAKWLYSQGDFMYDDEVANSTIPPPTFRMTVNKAQELVQLFGPAMYHKNPSRQATPAQPALLPPECFGDPTDETPATDPTGQPVIDPMTGAQMTAGQVFELQYQELVQIAKKEEGSDKARALTMQSQLNATPSPLDLKSHSRNAIEEALVKGLGLLWTEVYQPAGLKTKMVGSFFDTSDNLFIDPDADKDADVRWIMRQCIHPYWQVEREYGYEPGSLKPYATMESSGAQAAADSNRDGNYLRRQNATCDLIVYYKLYSKMGVGGRLMGASPELLKLETEGGYGDFVYLVITEKCPHPLNVKPADYAAMRQAKETAAYINAAASGIEPSLVSDPATDPAQFAAAADQAAQQAAAVITKALEWPTPFWTGNTWPYTPIQFHRKSGQVWPISHLGPALGELRFINWAMSCLMSKIRVACRDFIAIAASAGQEILKTIRNGSDYTFLEIKEFQGSIDQVVKFLQHPTFNPEIYHVIDRVIEMFDKRTGLTELMYGQSARQIRSAEEASVKSGQISIRPDDMANLVEDAMSAVSAKEAFASRWHLTAEDVKPFIGEVGASAWSQFIETCDPATILYQMDYRVEAGSARKPNKARDVANMTEAVQNFSQPFFTIAQTTGQVGPFNALVEAWGKANDFSPEQISRMLIAPPPPPPPMPAPGGEAPPAGGPPAAAA